MSGAGVMKCALAIIAALVAIYLSVCIWRDKWPTFIGIHNQIEDAVCEFAIDESWTWKVSLKAGEKKHWLFPFGEPGQVVGVCRTPTRQVAIAHGFCSSVNSPVDQTILINENGNLASPTDDGFVGTRVFCAIA